MRIYFLIFSICVLSFFIYQNIKEPQVRLNHPIDRIMHPTDVRLRYKIADIDPRFGITQQEAIQLTSEANEIWKQGTGKDYFLYDPNAKFTIYFEYDERQQETSQRIEEQRYIKNNKDAWEQKNRKINSIKEEIAHINMVLQNKKNELNRQLDDFNQQVAMINQNGGIHENQKLAYLQQKNILEQNIDLLKIEINQFNEKIYNLNMQVDELNQLNDEVRHSVQKFNEKFKPRMFDKGSFNGQSIRIFEFESKDDLRLTLAHEFGHALGLKHNDEPQALMYPYMKDQNMNNFRLLPEDLKLFKNR